jgi:hypothetical protein
VKLFLSNIIDKPLNPLNQSISRNHKQGTNPKATRKLSAHGTSETPGCQASKPLVIPIKGNVIQLSGENKKKQRNIGCVNGISIHLLKNNNHRAWDMIEA